MLGKRKLHRYEHGNLAVKVKKAGLLSVLFSPKIVSWLDFTQEGIAFISDNRYTIGTLLKLDLSLVGEQQIQTNNISAVVKNIQTRPEGFRYGLEFDFDQNNYMRTSEVKTALADMEQLLEEIYYQLTGKQSFHTEV